MYLGVSLCCVVSYYSYRLWLGREPRDHFWYIPFLWAPARFSDYKFSFFRLDVYSCPMWSELSHVQTLVVSFGKLLPEVVLGSTADSTTITYLFRRWRSWASRFPEVSVLPATPAYVALYLLSVLQVSTSPAPVQTALYNNRWAHDLTGFQSPMIHKLPQKVLESARRRLSHQKSPMTTEILLKSFQSLNGFLVDTRFMDMALLAYAGFLRQT